MLFGLNDKRSSRLQIDLKEVKDNILVLPGNKYRLVLQTSAINFELKSEAEQDTITKNFQNFLNSLPCPIQILVRVRELDIEAYLKEFVQKNNQETDEVYLKQIKNYQEFVKQTVKGNTILSRKFYLVIPYESKKRGDDFNLIKQQLKVRKNIVIRGLERLGMKATALSSLDTLDLFYSFYNPKQAKTQPIKTKTYQLLANNQDVVQAQGI